MKLDEVTVTDVYEAVTIFSKKGRKEHMQKRKCYGISLCIDGEITYTQNGKKFLSDKSSVVILPKWQSYSIIGDKTGRFPVINFDCREDLTKEIILIKTQRQEELLRDFEAIKSLFSEGGSRARIFSIFYNMLHDLTSANVSLGEIEPAINLINENYRDPYLSNAMLAAACNISEVYFRRLFLKLVGISPKQYVIDVRIQKAKQLLAEGIMKISAISELSGFSNQYHFSRCFKEKTGLSPTEYRKTTVKYVF